ncbi:hypothetical protein BU14_0231s0005 [Porphyra umbilicalis]|uniref:Uncharacterized protein n=1 Tax=Porphyra umbilicalis TaxID=2786 RepID=A0A1X6P3U8_PORUM|nr:hypothetical protein BU14_0231s0005 [Porphyra umbilicalis]|eukprot:OSX75552.1 hypothetical protein BU14_0231s0005 [Porphyra umbilicalis]
MATGDVAERVGTEAAPTETATKSAPRGGHLPADQEQRPSCRDTR